MVAFFSPSDEAISISEFVNKYNNSYYLGNDQIVTSASQSSPIVENAIDSILKRGIESEIDVAKILAWKIGKIKHKESEAAGRLVYAKDWVRAEELRVTRYGRPFDLEGIAAFVAFNISELETMSVSDPQGVLNRLRDQNTKGLGTVYLITLLYFISKGRYPIYDRFAKMALYAIRAGLEPGAEVPYADLPGKESRKRFERVFDDHMVPYIEDLRGVFGEKALQGRDVDRALWVYGHCFKQARMQA